MHFCFRGLRFCASVNPKVVPMLLVHGPSFRNEDLGHTVPRWGRLHVFLKLDWEIPKVLRHSPSVSSNYSCLLVQIWCFQRQMYHGGLVANEADARVRRPEFISELCYSPAPWFRQVMETLSFWIYICKMSIIPPSLICDSTIRRVLNKTSFFTGGKPDLYWHEAIYSHHFSTFGDYYLFRHRNMNVFNDKMLLWTLLRVINNIQQLFCVTFLATKTFWILKHTWSWGLKVETMDLKSLFLQ